MVLGPPTGPSSGKRDLLRSSRSATRTASHDARAPADPGAGDDREAGAFGWPRRRARDVDAAQLGDRDEALFARATPSSEVGPGEREVGGALFAVADDDRIDDGRERPGVRRDRTGPPAMTSGSSSPRAALRSGIPPMSSMREDVRVRELELEREADDVEVAQRARALERDERHLVRAEELPHVDPRRVRAFAERARDVVQIQ